MKFLTEDEIVDNFVSDMMLLDVNPHEQIEYIKSLARFEMIRFHNNVGMYIRNTYNLWHKDCPLTCEWTRDTKDNNKIHITEQGIDEHPCHPDAVSMNILYKIWDRIQNEP